MRFGRYRSEILEKPQQELIQLIIEQRTRVLFGAAQPFGSLGRRIPPTTIIFWKALLRQRPLYPEPITIISKVESAAVNNSDQDSESHEGRLG